jgi:hypothetical protein
MHRMIAVGGLLCVVALVGCSSTGGRQAATTTATHSDAGGPTTTTDPTPAVIPQTTRLGETTPQAVIADLRAHGFTVTRVKEADVSLSGAKDNRDAFINGVDCGILVFATPEGTQEWAELSDSLGGIAVVGDTWAISLDSSTPAKSRPLARKIAAAVGGTVR